MVSNLKYYGFFFKLRFSSIRVFPKMSLAEFPEFGESWQNPKVLSHLQIQDLHKVTSFWGGRLPT